MLDGFLDVQNGTAGDTGLIHDGLDFALVVVLAPVDNHVLQIGHIVVAAQIVGGVAGILQQLFMADSTAEGLEQLVVADAQSHETVLALEDVEGSDGGVDVAVTLRDEAADGVVDQSVLQQGEDGIEHSNVNVLALAGDITMMQSQQGAHCQIDTGNVVSNRGTDLDGIGVLETGQVDHAAHSLCNDVVAGTMSDGAVLAETGTGGVDDVGIDLTDGFVVDLQLLGNAAAIVLDQDVSILDQLIEHLQTLLGLQVQGSTLLVAVDVVEETGLAALLIQGAPGTALLAAQRLDLQNFCAVVGQNHGAERTIQCSGQVDDLQTFQRLSLSHKYQNSLKS